MTEHEDAPADAQSLEPYDDTVHQQVLGYAQNVPLRALLDLTEDEIVTRHDALLHPLYGNSIMGADEYRAEYYRRATLKAAQKSEDYARSIDRLVIALAIIAAVPVALDFWDRFQWGDHVGALLAAARTAIAVHKP